MPFSLPVSLAAQFFWSDSRQRQLKPPSNSQFRLKPSRSSLYTLPGLSFYPQPFLNRGSESENNTKNDMTKNMMP